MSGAWIRVAGAGFAAAMLALPAAAQSATLSLVPSHQGGDSHVTLIYSGDPEEHNKVHVTRSGNTYTFNDFGTNGDGGTIAVDGQGGCLDNDPGSPGTPPTPPFLGLIGGSPGTPPRPASPARCTGTVERIVLLGNDEPDELLIDAVVDVVPGTNVKNLLHGGENTDRLIQSGTVIQADDMIGGPITGAAPADRVDRIEYLLRPTPGQGVNADPDCAADDGYQGVLPEEDNIGASIEYLIGTDNADVMTGLNGVPTLDCPESDAQHPLPINDRLEGRGGTDVLHGSPGNDQSFGGDHNDLIAGGLGDDVLSGGSGDDIVRGDQADVPGGGDDEIFGDAGNDVLAGDDGDDTLHGGPNADRLAGGNGIDDLDGDTEDDVLDLGPAEAGGLERAEGDEGDDLLDLRTRTGVPGQPGDAVDGDAGTLARVTGGGVGQALIANLEAYWAGEGDDVITGTDRDEVISAGRGNDSVDAAEGEDLVDGGEGDDRTLAGGLGDDVLLGQQGDDALVGGDGEDVLHGGSGDDDVDGRRDADEMSGGDAGGAPRGTGYAAPFDSVPVIGAPGHDTVRYREVRGNPALTLPRLEDVKITLDGQANDGALLEGDDVDGGFEVLIGGDGEDTLLGDAHDEALVGGRGADILDGAGGNDVVSYGLSEASLRSAGVVATLERGVYDDVDEVAEDLILNVEHLTGSPFNDFLFGKGGFNEILGGGGDDRLNGGVGTERDRLIGGGGIDTASYTQHVTGVSATLNDADAPEDELLGIEGLLGSSHNDTLTGSGGANRIDGAAGDDLIFGLGGSDQLFGSEGGGDTVSYSDSLLPVAATLHATGTSSATNGPDTDALSGFEHLVGGAAGDLLRGSDGVPNVLLGNGGNDVLHGGNGDGRNPPEGDRLDGGPGFDRASWADRGEPVVAVVFGAGTSNGNGEVDFDGQPIERDALVAIESLQGGEGPDRLYGDDGPNDLIGGGGRDRLAGRGGRDVLLGGFENDRLEGGDDQDDLSGGPGADSLDGQHATDVLDGGPGEDLLHGGDTAADRDTLRGGEDHDRVTYAGRTDQVLAGIGLSANAPQDIVDHTVEELIGGSAGDLLQGSSGNDILRGAGGSDQLLGLAGDDRMVGGPDADTIDGGTGEADIASYEERSSAVRLALPPRAQPENATTEDVLRNVDGLQGGSGDDLLLGNDLANVLVGGLGADTVDGAGGNDFLRMRDGVKDTITCGAGEDFAELDPQDGAVGADCEAPVTGDPAPVPLDAAAAVDQDIPAPPPGVGGPAPAPAPQPTTPAPPAPTPTGGAVTVLSGQSVSPLAGLDFTFRSGTRLRSARLSVRLGCLGTRDCRFSVLVFRGRARVGRATVLMSPGTKRTARIRIARGTRRLLARRGRVRLTVEVRALGSGGSELVRRRGVTVRR